MTVGVLWRWRATLVLCIVSRMSAQVTLEDALTEDILPESSALCVGGGETTFTFDFSWTNSSSKWDILSAPFEKDAFLAELSHVDNNVNKTWSLRVGHGGNIYSYVGPYGEAMPPQQHSDAPWIDEVWQLVAVDSTLNDPPEDPYFIHQAGTYQNEDILRENPFYSPNVAKHCSGRECRFASWGQQAHVPTAFYSSALYYTRYRDCGNGVVEMTWAIQNGRSNYGSDSYSYFNVPWGGVRTSVLHDVLHASKSNPGEADLVDPLLSFGSETRPNLEDLGGYTTFTENIPLESEFSVPCGDNSGSEVDCNDDDAVAVQLIPSRNNSCSESVGHTASWGRYTARMTIQSTVTLSVSTYGDLLFTNPRGQSVYVKGVLHWAHNGNTLFFWPNVTVDVINSIFIENDIITVTYADFGKRKEDNLALTWVHGIDAESDDPNNDWMTAPSRVRVGTAGTKDDRDYTVFTINAFLTLHPGSTYYNRQYVITDRLSDIDAEALKWVDQTYQWVDSEGDREGRAVVLYSYDTVRFGAAVNGSHTCGEVRCSGYTTPHSYTQPLFSINCGAAHYVGVDRYHFAPNRTSVTDPLEPYLCKDEESSVRATWKLLGYFVENSCDYLENAEYDSTFCTSPTSLPTSSPSTSLPTSSPTLSASVGMTLFLRPNSYTPRQFQLQSSSLCSFTTEMPFLNATSRGTRLYISPSESDSTIISRDGWPVGNFELESIRIYMSTVVPSTDTSYRWTENLLSTDGYMDMMNNLLYSFNNRSSSNFAEYNLAVLWNTEAQTQTSPLAQIAEQCRFIAEMLEIKLISITRC